MYNSVEIYIEYLKTPLRFIKTARFLNVKQILQETWIKKHQDNSVVVF